MSILKQSIGYCVLTAGLLYSVAGESRQAKPPLRNYTARYQVFARGLTVGHIDRQLSSKKGNYLLKVTTKSHIPMIKLGGFEESRGTWGAKHPKPQQYFYEYDSKGKNKQRTWQFDHKKHRVVNAVAPIDLEIGEDPQDKLSYQLALREDLLANKQPLTYHVFDGKHLRDYQFTIRGTQTISTSLGQLETVVIQRQGKKRTTTLWLSKKFDYFIVKVQHSEPNQPPITAELQQVTFG